MGRYRNGILSAKMLKSVQFYCGKWYISMIYVERPVFIGNGNCMSSLFQFFVGFQSLKIKTTLC